MRICGHTFSSPFCTPLCSDVKNAIITAVAVAALAILLTGALQVGGVISIGLLGAYGGIGLIVAGSLILSVDIIAALIKKSFKTEIKAADGGVENIPSEAQYLDSIQNELLKLFDVKEKIEVAQIDWNSIEEIKPNNLKKIYLFRGKIAGSEYIGFRPKNKGVIHIIQITSVKGEKGLKQNCGEVTFHLTKFKNSYKNAKIITFTKAIKLSDFPFHNSEDHGLVPKMECPIGKHQIEEAYQLNCGHLFEKENLVKSLNNQPVCPCCRKPPSSDELTELNITRHGSFFGVD